MNINDKTGALVGAMVAGPEDDELLAISVHSQVIRTPLRSISQLKRATQGVRIMKLRSGDNVASFTLI
jgi:DNA gyrase subunit A